MYEARAVVAGPSPIRGQKNDSGYRFGNEVELRRYNGEILLLNHVYQVKVTD